MPVILSPERETPLERAGGTNMVHYCYTTLSANSGNTHPLLLKLYIKKNRKITRVEVLDLGQINPRVYELLDLAAQLLPESIGDASRVSFVWNPGRHCRYPALKVEGKEKTFRLDHQVDPRWLLNKELPDLVAFWREWKDEDYHLFAPPTPYWSVWTL